MTAEFILRPIGYFLGAALAFSAGAPGPAAAQAAGDTRPLWELGAFGVGVSQQAYPGSDQQVSRGLVLPFAVVRGRVLRADRDTAGLRALRTPAFELDVGVAGSFGASSGDIEARRGLPRLGTLVEAGPRATWHLGDGPVVGTRWRLELPLRGVFDLDDGLAHRGLALEPELSLRGRTGGGTTWSAGLGAIVADRALARTFYEVGPDAVTPDRPAWQARPGLVAWRLSASVSRPLSPDWRLFAFTRVDSVDGAANAASPLVRRTVGATVGAGLAWTWRRATVPGSD